MSAVDIRLNPSDLSREMAAMRLWLDQHRFEASGFACRQDEGSVLVSLEFKRDGEARAFAKRFGARSNHGPATDADGGLANPTLTTGLSRSRLIG